VAADRKNAGAPLKSFVALIGEQGFSIPTDALLARRRSTII
jgi:hypothetical protein